MINWKILECSKRTLRINSFILPLLAGLCLALAACDHPLISPPTPRPLESPLIPGVDTPLSQNRWRLIELTSQGESLKFDLIEPVFIEFAVRGELVVYTTNCNAWGNIIHTESERRYRLTVGESTAIDCPEAVTQQAHDLGIAIRHTTEYTIEENRLILSGDQVRIVLEVDNP